MIGLTYAELKALSPCADRLRAAAAKLGGARKWGRRKVGVAEAVAAGITLDDLVWVVSAMAADAGIERRLRLWMADCAAHVLHFYEQAYPNDVRPRQAIVAGRRFARGEIEAAARAAAWDAAWATALAALAAASDATMAAASDAARATAWAALAAASDAASDAARAAAWAAASDAWDAASDATMAAASDAEEAWQCERLAAWFSNPEPSDWPLPETEPEENRPGA